jgi:hypothetical protein
MCDNLSRAVARCHITHHALEHTQAHTLKAHPCVNETARLMRRTEPLSFRASIHSRVCVCARWLRAGTPLAYACSRGAGSGVRPCAAHIHVVGTLPAQALPRSRGATPHPHMLPSMLGPIHMLGPPLRKRKIGSHLAGSHRHVLEWVLRASVRTAGAPPCWGPDRRLKNMTKLSHAEATSRAMCRLRYQGKNQGLPPYGYCVASDGVTLVPASEEQTVLDFVRRLSKFSYSTREIARVLNEKGYVSRSGKPFRQTQVVRMLQRC